MQFARKKLLPRSNRRPDRNAKISGMENSAACAAADILMLTVPFEGQAALLKQLKPSIKAGSISSMLPSRWRLA